MRRSSLFFLILFFLIPFFLLPNKIHASEGSIEVDPAYLEKILDQPEQEESIVLTYKNHSKKNITLEIFAVDFKQQNERGGISFLGKEAGSYSYSLSSFLSFESNHLDIEAKKEAKLRISIKNRLDLSPGGHYAAVVARFINESKDENTISPALSSLIFMRKVGGERFNLSIKDVDWPKNFLVFDFPSVFEITFQNEGNTHLTPYGRGEIIDISGKLLYKGIINTSSAIVMPESRRIIPIEFKLIEPHSPFLAGRLLIRGNDSIKKTNYIYEEGFIYVNPFLLTFIVLVPIVFIVVRKRHKNKKIKEKLC